MKNYLVAIALAIGAAGCESAQTELDPSEPISEPPSSTQRSPWDSELQEYPSGALADELDETEEELIGAHNWRTGRAFTEREVRRLKRLTEAVGENYSLTPLSEEGRQARQRYWSETRELATRLDSPNPSRDEIEDYYGRKIAFYDDRIEVIEFILDEPGWDEETMERYERYLVVAEKEQQRFERQRLTSLARFDARNPKD